LHDERFRFLLSRHSWDFVTDTLQSALNVGRATRTFSGQFVLNNDKAQVKTCTSRKAEGDGDPRPKAAIDEQIFRGRRAERTIIVLFGSTGKIKPWSVL
jgi:hypothetical protein